MREPQEIKELEAQIALDKQKYSEIDRLEDELLGNIPPDGFREATTIGRYRAEKKRSQIRFRVAEESWREREASPADLHDDRQGQEPAPPKNSGSQSALGLKDQIWWRFWYHFVL